jgi:subtilase family serine protease
LDVEYVPERRGKGCVGPDLVVESIARPSWEAANSQSVITAGVKNVGNVDAAASLARVIDPTTPPPSGAPHDGVANVPPLGPGASFTAVFYLPYWVYNPDVTLELTADYKGQVEECNEQNSTNVFNDIG